MKKVVITGIGAVTSIGYTAEDYWNGLIEGKCGMRTITRIPLDNHDTTVAAEVDDAFEAVCLSRSLPPEVWTPCASDL